jgi:hypothetical protein
VLIHGYTGSAEGNWYANGIAPALARDHRVGETDPERVKQAEALDAKGEDPQKAEGARGLRIRSARNGGLRRERRRSGPTRSRRLP